MVRPVLKVVPTKNENPIAPTLATAPGRHVLVLVAMLVCALSASAGCSPKKPADDATSNIGHTRGFTHDDKARCEYEGRSDREVVETTTAGASRPNVRRVYQVFGEGEDRRRVLICREADVNLDGIKDVMRLFNDQGEPIREEADTNFDGIVDSWIIFSNGRIVKHELDTNGDGMPDVWKYYSQGGLSRIQRDTNFDGRPDVWEIYVRGQLDRVGVDIDFDGRVDRWDRDEIGRIASETKSDGGETATENPNEDTEDGKK
ncbi:MAG: hypothetical protein FWD57_01790 [Polyangiaceae bacterium]|nr:hypothetical protein [Polyangiaceae bacterium]